MEMIYIAAAIMMGLGGMGAAIGVVSWAVSSLKVLRVSQSWLHVYRVILPGAGLVDAIPIIGVGIAMYLIFVVAG